MCSHLKEGFAGVVFWWYHALGGGFKLFFFFVSLKMHYFISKKFMSASGSGAVPVNGIFHGFVKGRSSPPLIFTFLLLIFPSLAFLLQNNPVTGSFCTFHTIFTVIYLWEALLIPLGVVFLCGEKNNSALT